MLYLLPENTNPLTVVTVGESSAFAFPIDTRAEWVYDEQTNKVTTTYTVAVENKEVNGTALMPSVPKHR